MAIEQPTGASRARILVVDDHPMNLSAFRRLLHQHYEVLAAPSGIRALEIVAGACKPDLILLDVMMPGMNGLQVLERLREDPLSRAIPVILVTVLDTQDSHAEGFRAGAVDFIAKPFGPDIVLARIATHLALKKATDDLAACRNSLTAEVARRSGELMPASEVVPAQVRTKREFSLAEAEELRSFLRGALGAAQRQSPSGLDDDLPIEVTISAGKARSLLAVVDDLLDVSA